MREREGGGVREGEGDRDWGTEGGMERGRESE